MYIIFILVLLMMLVTFFSVNASEFHVKVPSVPPATSISHTTDGGYIVAGINTVFKFDSDGNIAWDRRYVSRETIYSVIETEGVHNEF